MSGAGLQILADAEVKVLVWLVIGAIWAISQIVSKLSQKAAPTIQPRKQPGPPPRPIGLANTSIPLPRPLPPRPMAVQQVAIPIAAANRLNAARMPARPMPPPVPVRAPQKAPAPAPQARPEPAPAPPTISQPVAAYQRPTTGLARGLNRWMRPDTLRQQFLLTEILREPLALRDEPQ